MIRAQDGPPSPKDISRRVHVAGRAMLSTNMLNAATGAMRSLHDNVLSLEKRRLSQNDVAYPVFVAKVPEGKGFVDGAIGVRSSCGLMTSLLCLTFIRCTTPSFGYFR